MPSSTDALATQVLRTGELASWQKQQFCELFETVFQKPFPIDLFERKYLRVPGHDSFHVLLSDGDAVVGAYNAIPLRYRINGNVVTAAIPADLMIHPNIRPALRHLGEMMDHLYAALTASDVAFIVALLRSNVFRMHNRIADLQKIGSLTYYAAAARSSVIARLVAPFVLERSFPSSVRGSRTVIERVRESTRYSLFPTEYRMAQLSSGEVAAYMRQPYFPIGEIPHFLRVAYVIDAPSPVSHSLDELMERLSTSERDLHAAFYLGPEGLSSKYFRRLKPKFQKPEWCAAGKVLRPDLVDAAILSDSTLWNLSLGDSDLL